VIIEFRLALLTSLVGRVAGVASRVERCMPAAFFWNVQPLRVAFKTEVLALIARCRLEQLILVVRRVRAVAFQTIANGGRMDGTIDGSRVHVSMTRDAERLRRRRLQFNAGDVLVHPDFMATGAARGDCGMNELAFGFVFVTLDAS